MSWNIEVDEGNATTLQWWKENFIISAAELFKAVDNCVSMDIQVHNLTWYVQEAQTARIAVHMLNESQAWFQDYLLELSSKRHNDDSNYWGESSDEEEAEAESHAKQRYDEVFALLKVALGNIRALITDTDDWVKLGSARRLGKHVWHNYRMFERTYRLHCAILRIIDIADMDVYKSHYRKEPNYGVARKIKHPAVRKFWYDYIAPKVLASHTGMVWRTPPGLHPSKIQEHLACIDAVSQAPIATIAGALIKFLKLGARERLILPYLLSSGCCDHEYGGHHTFGLNPCCHLEAFDAAKKKWEAQADLVLLGPGGGGWADNERMQEMLSQAKEEEARLETVWRDALRQAVEFVDCKCLQSIMDYWCPLPEVQRNAHATPEEILPHFYQETRWAQLELDKLAFELPLRAKGQYPPYPTLKGVRKLGAKAVFRAGVYVLIAGFRLWRLQPWGLKAYLEDKISQTHDAEEKLDHSITMADERIMREKAKAQPRQHEVDYWEEVVSRSKLELAAAIGSRDRYRERSRTDIKLLPGGRLPRHPLYKAIQAAAASLVWTDPQKDEKLRLPDRVVPWFHFECSNDLANSLLNLGGKCAGGGGRFLLRYSKEPGIFVCNWSEGGQGREQKSARIYRVLHAVASGPARADLKTPPAGGKVDGSSVADAGDGQGVMRLPLGRKGAVSTAQAAAARKAARKREQIEAGSSVSESFGRGESTFDEEAVGGKTGGGGKHVENKPVEFYQGFAWNEGATSMETYDALSTLVYAARGMLRNTANNTNFQLAKRAGYLD